MKRYIKPAMNAQNVSLTMPLAGSQDGFTLTKGGNETDVEARSDGHRGFWDGVWDEE